MWTTKGCKNENPAVFYRIIKASNYDSAGWWLVEIYPRDFKVAKRFFHENQNITNLPIEIGKWVILTCNVNEFLNCLNNGLSSSLRWKIGSIVTLRFIFESYFIVWFDFCTICIKAGRRRKSKKRVKSRHQRRDKWEDCWNTKTTGQHEYFLHELGIVVMRWQVALVQSSLLKPPQTLPLSLALRLLHKSMFNLSTPVENGLENGQQEGMISEDGIPWFSLMPVVAWMKLMTASSPASSAQSYIYRFSPSVSIGLSLLKAFFVQRSRKPSLAACVSAPAGDE